ncbi:MAG: C1 family peptidase [Opitutales bacterium]
MNNHTASSPPARLLASALFGLLLALPALLMGESHFQEGDEFARMTIGDQTFHQVRIQQITPHSVLLRHRRGLSSVAFRDMPERWQAAFGYDPGEGAEPPPPAEPLPRPSTTFSEPAETSVEDDPLAALRARFDQSPTLQAEVDFAKEVHDFPVEDYHPRVQWQGPRHSCAVFAVCSALELQFARETGKFRRFSERYVDWAIQQTTTRRSRNVTDDGIADLGYSLHDVLRGLDAFGVAAEPDFPDVTEDAWETAPPPSEELIAEARQHGQVRALRLPGRGASLVDRIIQALNAREPVVIALHWPHARGTRHGTISLQTPRRDYAHAVTLFGYQSDGTLNGTRFRLRNSWGRDWGVQGYGWVTYEYLTANILDALVVDYLPTS